MVSELVEPTYQQLQDILPITVEYFQNVFKVLEKLVEKVT